MLQDFEKAAVRFAPVVLTGSGLFCLVAGLFVWLGGLGFRRLLIAVTGAIAGVICGLFVFGKNITSAGLLAAAAAVIAMVFEKVFVAILAAALAAVFGLAILAAPYFPNTDETALHTIYNTYGTGNQDETFDAGLTAEVIKAYIADFSCGARQALLQMPRYNLVIIVSLTAVFIAAGFFFSRLTLALCCAALGTLLVFTALILLLLYKGAVPMTYICDKNPFFAAVFAAMIIFGTIEQLILCRYAGKRTAAKKRNKDDSQASDKVPQSWRTT